MAVALADLVSRLQSAVPARDGIPSPEGYAQHVKDAVLQLAQDAPLRRTADLAIVAGVATYSLPSDFLFLIELESLCHPAGVRVSSAGLIPTPVVCTERYEIVGGQIAFDPTPAYSLTRRLRYGALYELSGPPGGEQYATLSENGARIALLYAQVLALTEQGNRVAGSGWRYQIGDEMVDKTGQGKGLLAQADALLAQYRRAAAQQKGYGSQGQAGMEALIWAC